MDDGRTLNFSAGPAMMPRAVLEQLAEELIDVDGRGIGLMELGHRSDAFTGILEAAERSVRIAVDVPDTHAVLFVPGGATLQYAMIPMNLRPAGTTAVHVDTGVWTSKAIEEASLDGEVHVAWTGRDHGYERLPLPGELTFPDRGAYLHYCSNNTIHGTSWPAPPETGPEDLPRVVDATSDLLARPIDVAAHGLVYASAQKNLGPAGLAVVIVRHDLLDSVETPRPRMLDYRAHLKAGSRLNTPPTFAVRALGLMAAWAAEHGRAAEMGRRAQVRAHHVYREIDDSDGFYRCPVAGPDRSSVNVVFRTPSKELDARFVAAAEPAGLVGLRGHRLTGGMRASMYNAMPTAGAERLAAFMRTFRDANG